MKKQFKTNFLALWSMLLISSMSWGQIPNYVPTNGLVGWWPFNGNANDESGNGNNGTVNGAILTTDRNGVANNAYFFSGVNCQTRIDATINTSSINISNEYSISIWVYKSGEGCMIEPRILEFYSTSNGALQFNWGVANGVQNSFMVETINNSGLYQSTSFIFSNWLNNWNNIVFTAKNGEAKLYLNGIIMSTFVFQGLPSLVSNASFGRMNHPAYNTMNGKLDDIGLWNRVLTPCEISALYTGQLSNPPTVDLGNDTLSVCSTSTTLDATNTAAGDYLWNTGATTPTLDVTNSGSYFVTVTDTSGCSATDSIYVSVIDPTITAQESAFCLGDSTLLSVQSSGNTCGALSGSLQNGLVGWWPFCGNANDESGNGNNGMVNGATLTTDRFGNSNQAYSFDGVDDYIQCPQNNIPTQNLSLSVWINPNSTFANMQFVCLGSASSTRWGVVASNNNAYIGYGAGCSGSGGSILTNCPISNSTWINLVYVSSGVGGVTQIYKNGVLLGQVPNSTTVGGCSTSNLFFGVDIFSLPEFINGKLDDIGIWNRSLTQQEIQSLYNQGNLSTWWSDGTTNQSSIQVQPTQTTTYSVTVSDGVGTCTDSITIQVNNPQINAGADFAVCAGDSATLTATGANSYSWDNGVVNGQAFVPTVEGYYTVTGIDTLGCSNTASVYLDLLQPTSSVITITSCDTYTAPDNTVYNNSGQYTAIIPNAAGCDSTITINLTVNNTNTGIDSKTACDSYTWIDGITYTESNNTATFTLQNASGCDSVVTLNLTLNKLQNLNAGADQSVCKGENVTLTASGAETYSWNNGVSDGVAFSPPLGTTTYTVTGIDGNGCTDTDEVVVTSEYCFEIPGALSPNSDNNNDTWEITGLQNYPNAIISVFDRWGQKVYEGTSTSAPWNGKYQDKDLPTADYYYIIELGNGDTYNGVVTLKR